MKRHERELKNGGAALLLVVLLMMFVSMVIIIGFSTPLLREYQKAKEILVSADAFYMAEAGLEDVYYRLKTGQTIVSPEVLSVGGGYATTTLTSAAADTWEITSYAQQEIYVRNVYMSVSNAVTDADFPYGAQVGDGGIVMDNGAIIQGAGGSDGDVYSNGSIMGSIGATITGDITVSTGITEDTVERSTVCTDDLSVGQAVPEIDFAQSFVASSSEELAKISLYLKKSTNPGDRTIRIVADDGGQPDDVSLSDGTLTAALVGTSYAWIDVVFPTPATLVAGNTYWIVLDATNHASKYWFWCGDSAEGYTNGEAMYSEDWDDDPWTSIAYDLTFKIYYGEGFSEINDVTVTGVAKANTITNSTIGGDAYYQTFTGGSIGGTPYPGSADPPVIPMPLSDANIASWKTAAAAGGVVSGDCPGTTGCSLTMGAAQIDGDLTITINDTFTLTGVVHVTGDLYPENNTTIKCDIAYGDQSCILVVDGNIDVSNNVTFAGSGVSSDSFILALSTIEGCDGVTVNPACAPQNSAIYVANNATGVIFYGTDSLVYLNNGVNVTTVVANMLHLANGAIVTYDTNVDDLEFAAGPDGGWGVNSWAEIE